MQVKFCADKIGVVWFRHASCYSHICKRTSVCTLRLLWRWIFSNAVFITSLQIEDLQTIVLCITRILCICGITMNQWHAVQCGALCMARHGRVSNMVQLWVNVAKRKLFKIVDESGGALHALSNKTRRRKTTRCKEAIDKCPSTDSMCFRQLFSA